MTYGRDIPRYTEEDKEILLAKYKDDVIVPGVTLGDLYRKQLRTGLVPLEDYTLNRCFARRIVLLGDSFHKV